MHPNYGKQAGRYKKLDPISADSMPPTGDPETDAVVNKQKTKRRRNNVNDLLKRLHGTGRPQVSLSPPWRGHDFPPRRFF